MLPPAKQESTFNATHIVSAVLLAMTGGTLDAVVYLNHGHVFANAMTGNVIFLGISLVGHDWLQALRHTAPIAAFLVGATVARLVRAQPIRHAALLVLSLECAALLLVGFLPVTFPQIAYTSIVAFFSAFQVTTFRRVGRFTYNSTFTTGNLREVAEGVGDRLSAVDPAARYLGVRKASKLSAICCAFLVGALIGAWVAPRFPEHAILAALPPLVVTLLLTLTSQIPDPSHE